jgi:hypothetical protein
MYSDWPSAWKLPSVRRIPNVGEIQEGLLLKLKCPFFMAKLGCMDLNNSFKDLV